MARYQKQRTDYPMGSVSCGTMRNEDLIPAFTSELERLAARTDTGVAFKTRQAHLALCAEIDARMESEDYYDSEEADYDLNETLFDALNEYAAPYFYFGSHPGDGSDYGFWLMESWDEEFVSLDGGTHYHYGQNVPVSQMDMPDSIKVTDVSEIPNWYRGEVAVVNDHGNVTLYVKTSRALREVWAVV